MKKRQAAVGKTFRSAEPVAHKGVSSDFVRALQKVGASKQVVDAAKSQGVNSRRSAAH